MMNKQKVKGIIKFSINKSIQNKWFVILNVFMLIVILLTTNISNIKTYLENHNINLFDEELMIEVVDNGNLGFEKIKQEFIENEKIKIKKVDKNQYTKDTIDDTTIVVELEKDEEYILKSTIVSKEAVEDEIYNKLYDSISKMRAEIFSQEHNISLNELEIINDELKIDRVMLGVDADNYETKEMIKYISTFLIYMISIFVFSKIANDIAQEKVSKSIEYVLTSVNEKEYLLAKISSIIITILLQGMYFIFYYIIGNSINNLINITQMQGINEVNMLDLISNIDKEIVLYILIVFTYGTLTLILMSIIQAALSSKTTNMSEAGNTTMLLTMITIFSYFFTLFLITPYTNMTLFIYILACIPLLSNYFVPAIMIIGQANPILIIISLVILIISIPITLNICAKIFKNGVLDYNTKSKSKKSKIVRTFREEQEHKFKIQKYRNFSFVIGMAIMIYIVLQLLGEIIINIAVIPLINEYFTQIQCQLISMCSISIISLLVATLFINMYKNKEDRIEKKKIKLKEKIEIIFSGIFFLGIIQLLTIYISSFFGIENSVGNMLSMSTEGEGWLTKLLLFLTVAVQAAIFEELLFRKAFIDYSKRFGIVFSVIISSVFFGLIHMNMGQFIFALLIGIVFAIIYYATGNISLTMILHFLNNGYSVVLMVMENNELMVNIINVLTIIVMIIGALVLLKKIITNKQIIKNAIKNIKIEKSTISQYKYIFMDFTFIVSIIVVVLLFVITENVLSTM